MQTQCRKCGEYFTTNWPELVKICGHCLGVREEYRDHYEEKYDDEGEDYDDDDY